MLIKAYPWLDLLISQLNMWQSAMTGWNMQINYVFWGPWKIRNKVGENHGFADINHYHPLALQYLQHHKNCKLVWLFIYFFWYWNVCVPSLHYKVNVVVLQFPLWWRYICIYMKQLVQFVLYSESAGKIWSDSLPLCFL